MITPYLSQQPVNDFGFRFTEFKYSAALAASTVSSLTIPGVAPRYKALIKASGDVWVSINTTAVLPIAPTSGQLNPVSSELVTGESTVCREVKSGDILEFITSGTNQSVSVVLYGLNTLN